MVVSSGVQQIKERLTIEEVISSYIKLEPAGANLKARCPFHNEKTPSFFVSPERGSYYCFGCGASGDIFSFVENFEGLDFKGALKLLALRAGVDLGGYQEKDTTEKEKLYEVMEVSAKYFEAVFSTNQTAKKYLMDRGLTEKTIEEFRIGYAKDEWRDLADYLKKRGYTEKQIELAGLGKQNNGSFYDRFRGRIMFPIMDSSGRVIAFSGRIFVDDLPAGRQVVNQAKYLNSPETPIFHKSKVLYGIDKAKDAIRKNNFSILVEGQMDLIMSHQVGYKNTVASSGTALAESNDDSGGVSNLGLVRRLSNNIVLAFDSDSAGINASMRAAKVALSLGMDVKAAPMPAGIDPADMIKDGGKESWQKAIREAEHIILFLAKRFLSDAEGDKRKALRIIKEKVLPFIASVESAIEKAFFISQIANLAQVPEGSIKEDLLTVEKAVKIEPEQSDARSVERGSPALRKDQILRNMLSILLWQGKESQKRIDPEEVVQRVKDILGVEVEDLLKSYDHMKREEMIFEAEVFYKGDRDVEKEVGELLNNLEEEVLKEKLANKFMELKEAERNGEDAKKILQDLQIINNKLQNLKNI